MPICVPFLQISRGAEFAVHNYFHVCPESPDGTRVVYSAFPGGPGADRHADCEVILCDRDGTNHAVIGRARNAGHHRGAHPTWIDAFDLRDGALTPVVRIADVAPFADQVREAYDLAAWRFAHAYISPGGSRIAFLLRKRQRPGGHFSLL
jgi:hypothetical protein